MGFIIDIMLWRISSTEDTKTIPIAPKTMKFVGELKLTASDTKEKNEMTIKINPTIAERIDRHISSLWRLFAFMFMMQRPIFWRCNKSTDTDGCRSQILSERQPVCRTSTTMATVSMKDTSFLDPKLQLNLEKSHRIQSQLRLPVINRDSILVSSRKNSTENDNLFQDVDKFIRWHSNPEAAKIQLIQQLLLRSPSVIRHLDGFLSAENATKLLLMKDFVRSRDFEGKSSK